MPRSDRSERQAHSHTTTLVGNLRADIPHRSPYVRAIRDPFGTLLLHEVEQTQVRRAVQLRVREFEEAEELVLGVSSASAFLEG